MWFDDLEGELRDAEETDTESLLRIRGEYLDVFYDGGLIEGYDMWRNGIDAIDEELDARDVKHDPAPSYADSRRLKKSLNKMLELGKILGRVDVLKPWENKEAVQ